MSVEYQTKPPLSYERLLQAKTVAIVHPTTKYFNSDHAIVYKNKTFIHFYKDEGGNAIFVRFGKNDIHQVFPSIIEEFGVEIWDEYGTQYPDCLE